MNTQRDFDEGTQTSHVSTGRLPPAELVRTLVAEAHGRYKCTAEGTNSQAYPALAEVASDLFGVCVVGTGGDVYAVGDAEYEFSIMSVSKPFVFALVCQSLGAEQARQKLGVNATGFPFNSLSAVERSEDGRTNAMVNAGAIATTSLVPEATTDAKWRFIHVGLSRLPQAGNEAVKSARQVTSNVAGQVFQTTRSVGADDPLPKFRSTER